MPVFRTTPQLGPQLEDWSLHWHWDPDAVDSSYRLGNKETGSDGHEYVLVKAGVSLAAGTDVLINETTWVATAGAGTYEVPPGLINGPVPLNGYFHARKLLV